MTPTARTGRIGVPRKEREIMGWGTGWGMGGWVLMGLAMITFWVLVAFGLVALLRPSSRARGGGAESTAPRVPDRSSALRTLDDRFARGDMTEEDYRQRRDLLKGS